VRPNQALSEGVPSGQADGWSWVQLTWLSIGLVQMIKLSLWDSFRWLHDENYQRRSLLVRRLLGGAPIR